jgi:hypothetical protein
MTRKGDTMKSVQMNKALKNYQGGKISLRELVAHIEHWLEVVSDQALRDSVLDCLVALEEVHARTQIGDFDFEKDGRSVVDRAVNEILSRIGN